VTAMRKLNKFAFGMVASAIIGLFGFAFAAWIFYSALALYPNDDNFSMLGILATLGVISSILSLLVWRRIFRQLFGTKFVHVIAALVAILWLPLFLLSPSMVVFFLIAVALLALHVMFGRQLTGSISK
jgi:hypothetical protein